MKFFRIYVSKPAHDKTLELVKDFSHDILIENVEDDSIGITIERDEPEATALYEELIDLLKKSNLAPIR